MKKPAKKYLVIDVTNGEGYSTPSIYPFLSLSKAMERYTKIADEYEKMYDYDKSFHFSDLKEAGDPLMAKYLCNNGQDNMGVHMFEIPADCVPVVEIDTHFADEIQIHIMPTHKQAAEMIIAKSEEFPLEDEEDEDENNEYLHAGNHADGHVYIEAITDQVFREAGRKEKSIDKDENPKEKKAISFVEQIPNECALTAAVITNNLFDEIYDSRLGRGTINTYESIAKMAEKFVSETKNITDWNEESEKRGCSDWEECIIQFVQQEIASAYK